MKFIKLRDHLYAMVDDEDYGLVSQYKYSATNNNGRIYAVRRFQINNYVYRRYLHHDVLGTTPAEIKPLVVDHKDHNTLNCQKDNLRLCTHAQNCYNSRPARNKSSKYKGVSYVSSRIQNPWRVQLYKGGKVYRLGHYANEYQAFKIANVYAYRLYGRFAYLNNWTGPTRLCKNCGVFEKSKK